MYCVMMKKDGKDVRASKVDHDIAAYALAEADLIRQSHPKAIVWAAELPGNTRVINDHI